MPHDSPIETLNDQGVGVISALSGELDADRIVVWFPKQQMTRTEALRQAAWLVVLAEKSEGEFDQVLRAIKAAK